MKILLVGPNLEENLSIGYLASSLEKAGHRAVLTAFNSNADASLVREAAREVDMVGLSMAFQARAPGFLSLARKLKEESAARCIITGGHYASCAAHDLLINHPELDLQPRRNLPGRLVTRP